MIKKVFKSRTVLTIVLMFVIGGFQAVEPFLTQDVFMMVNGFLSVLAVYFRIDPRVDFSGK